MALIEINTDEQTAAIDPVFDNDHWICCDTPKGFVGMTKTFCGVEIMEYDPEYARSVGCVPCNRVALADYDYCPIKGKCTNANPNLERVIDT